ncbi:H+/gluconate symporter-like permease [Plasticicumulans acidivorans]|uniref:H+/gluconate symporter-like permease n=1 Tax=Plasticicumulans acidivorans TaxID=886464 RepID=A0A317MQV4_9GAMM|nr:H+/gluconate symporter-like permease [Plasticicumulans acidivorans]
MIGILGIVLSLALLIVLAYRGWNVIFIAPLCAGVALLFNWQEAPLLATYSQVYMPAMGNFLAKFFPLFLLGAVFGKLMEDSGAAKAIALGIVRLIGAERAILAVVLACAILTYGGVSLFVVAFSVYPIAMQLFRSAQIPKRLIPGAIALGSFTFTMTALPGTPAIQNAIPMPFFHTTPFAAPGMGIIAGLFMLVCGQLWLSRRAALARTAGEGYGEHHDVIVEEDNRDLPNVWLALLPLASVIALNALFTYVVIPAMDTGYLAMPKFGKVSLPAVLGVWAIIAAMAIAVLLVVLLNLSRFRDVRASITEGTLGSLLPVCNTAAEVGYGAVISGLGAFIAFRETLKSVVGDPLVSVAVVVNTLAGLTGSASGGLSLTLQAMGEYYRNAALAAGIDPEVMHRVATLASGGLDALPHNGAVITLLAITRLTHKDSYKDILFCAVVFPVLSGFLVVGLNAVFGTF